MIEEFTSMAVLREDLGFLLAQVSATVVRATNAALGGENLRVRQYAVLALACESAAGISQRSLARQLGLDPSQIVALVDELAEAGLAERRPVPGDRRARLVAATEAGHRARDRAAILADQAMRDSLGALTHAEQATLRVLLSRVALVTSGGPDGEERGPDGEERGEGG